MSQPRAESESPHDGGAGPHEFDALPEEHELSLDDLSAAYAELIQRGRVPHEFSPPPDVSQLSHELQEAAGAEADEADDRCEVTPRSILEAMLFVGNANNEPLTGKQVASLVRGVRPREIEELVKELNEQYDREGRPFAIVSVGAGYSLQLREEYGPLRDKFHRRVREARLSQAAIDVLAIVAYRQPLTREEIDELRGKPSGAVLTQLVRRQLLRIERPETKPRHARYYTTDRFLDLFGLESLAELPQSKELDKNF